MFVWFFQIDFVPNGGTHQNNHWSDSRCCQIGCCICSSVYYIQGSPKKTPYWTKSPKGLSINRRRSVAGKYQQAPTTPLAFNPKRFKGQVKGFNRKGAFSNEDKMKFQIFKLRQWSSVSPRLPSIAKYLKELENHLLCLSDKEMSILATPRPHQKLLYCFCQEPFKYSDSWMVQCNICDNWYNSLCIGMWDVLEWGMIMRSGDISRNAQLCNALWG